MFRRGRLPGRGEETELEVHSWTRRGFFGSYATLYKTRNPGDAVRYESGLGPAWVDCATLEPSDATRADGSPLPIMTNGEVTVSVSKRAAAMPFCWRNADADELYFIDRGHCLFETELGRLSAEPGDLVFLPRNVVYRTVPQGDEQRHLILETRPLLESAEP
jgi:homogentisate 1,2-dioxygenase